MVAERNQVFISYSHKDKQFLEDLLVHLKPLQRAGKVSAWSDKQIRPGDTWRDEIGKALASAKVAVMLVTKDFLASDFIHEHELGPLLKAAEKDGVRIMWVLVRACSYEETALKNYQAIIPLDKPLAEMKAERDKAWVRVCAEIKKAMDVQSAVGDIPGAATASQPRVGGTDTNPTFTTERDKQIQRLKVEWNLNRNPSPGVFQRAKSILSSLRAVVVDQYAELAEEPNSTVKTLIRTALDQIVYLEGLQITHDVTIHAFLSEGDHIFDLLRDAKNQ